MSQRRVPVAYTLILKNTVPKQPGAHGHSKATRTESWHLEFQTCYLDSFLLPFPHTYGNQYSLNLTLTHTRRHSTLGCEGLLLPASTVEFGLVSTPGQPPFYSVFIVRPNRRPLQSFLA
jgi:hypothetical protein